jgi:hypothetical protein
VYSTIGVAIVGVVVPIMIQMYASRQTRIAEKNFRDLLSNLVDEAKLDLKNILKADHESHKAELSAKLEKQELVLAGVSDEFKHAMDDKILSVTNQIRGNKVSMEAAIFHIQGLMLSFQNQYKGCCESLMTAIEYYVTANNVTDTRKCKGLLISTLTRLNKDDLDEKFMKIYDSLIQELKKANVNSHFDDIIKDIETAKKAAALREPPKPSLPSALPAPAPTS